MKKAWQWLKKWGGLVGGAIASVLLGILTLGWWNRRQKEKIDKARDEAAIAKAQSEVKRLQAVRAEVHARVGEEDEAIKHIDAQLREQKERVLEAANEGDEVKELSDEELEARVKRILGG